MDSHFEVVPRDCACRSCTSDSDTNNHLDVCVPGNGFQVDGRNDIVGHLRLFHNGIMSCRGKWNWVEDSLGLAPGRGFLGPMRPSSAFQQLPTRVRRLRALSGLSASELATLQRTCTSATITP